MSPIVLNRWRLVSFRGGKTAFPRPFTYLNYSCKPDIAKHRLYPWLCYGFFWKNCRLLRIFDEDRVLFTYFCLKNAKNVRHLAFVWILLLILRRNSRDIMQPWWKRSVRLWAHPHEPTPCSGVHLMTSGLQPCLTPGSAPAPTDTEQRLWATWLNPWCLITNIHY